MGYSFSRSITIDHTKVSTADQTDMPWLYTNCAGRLTASITNIATTIAVSQSITSTVAPAQIANNDFIKIGSEIMQVTAGAGTSSLTVTRAQMSTSAAAHTIQDWIINTTQSGYLATQANGGNVSNANGYDIVFSTDNTGTSLLAFEIDAYDPVSGLIFAWIKTTLSHTVDTVVYLCYGNSAISTYQGNNAGVWSNSYLGVWHLPNSAFPNGTTLGVNDSLGVLNGTITGSLTAAPNDLAGNGSFPGGSNYIDVGGASALNSTVLTIESWCQYHDSSNPYMVFSKDDGSAGGKGYDLFIGQGQITLVFADGSNQAIYRVNSATLSTVTFNHVAVTLTGSTGVMYFQGASVAFSNLGGAATSAASNTFTGRIGARSSGTVFSMLGNIDELRISSVVRSASWIATQFNNTDQPASFYTVSGPVTLESFVETFTLSEHFTATRTGSVNFSDTITLSDNLSKKESLNFLDTVSLAETLSTSTHRQIEKALADAITLSDHLSTQAQGKGRFVDTFVVTDRFSKLKLGPAKIRVIIYESGEPVDRTGLISENQQFGWNLMRSSRGTASMALQLTPTDTYAPQIDWPLDIYESIGGIPKRVWSGVIDSLDLKWTGNAGYRLLTLGCVTWDKVLDGTQLTQGKQENISDADIINSLLFPLVPGGYITLGTVTAGTSWPTIDLSGSAKDMLDKLALNSQSLWYIDPTDKTLNYVPYTYNTSPWVLDNTPLNLLWESLSWKQESADFRNKQIIQMASGFMSPYVDTFEGDGASESFTLSYTPSAIVSTLVSSSVSATATGTLTGQPNPGDTITIESIVYEAVATLNNGIPFQFLIGTTVDETAQALVDTINGQSLGVTGSLPTYPNTFVSAAQPAAGVFSIRAKTVGLRGNLITLSDAASNFSWSGALLNGGTVGFALRDYTVTVAANSTDVSVIPAMPAGVNATITYLTSAAATVTAASGGSFLPRTLKSTISNSQSPAEAAQLATSLLAAYAQHPSTMQFKTYRPGLSYCQYLTVNITRPVTAGAVLNGNWIVQEVQADLEPGVEKLPEPNNHFTYTVDLINSLDVAPFTNFWDNLANVTPLEPSSEQEPAAATAPIIYTKTLLLKDTTIGDNIADHVPIMLPEIPTSPVMHATAQGTRIVVLVKDDVASDLTVEIVKTNYSVSPVSTTTWTITVAAGTLALTPQVEVDISSVQFADGDILSANVTASDGSKDPNGIVSYTVEYKLT